MKKRNLLLILLFLLAAVFTLTACKDGEQGAKGEQGDKGATGEKGVDGDKGPKGDSGDKGDTGKAGADAKAPEFEVTEEGVMWRLEGEEDWHVLVSAEDLIGYSKKYTISFDANGGSEVKELTKQIFKTEVELPVSKLAGYTFAYWADAEGNEVEDNTLTVLGDTKLKAVWGSSVELSKTALGDAFDVSGLTEGISFNVTKFNSGANDGFTIDLGTQAKVADAAGAYWYRIFLKAVDAENGVYEIVGRLTSGESNSLADYPYDIMIGTHSACKDTTGYTALRGLVEADESPVGYIVKITGLDLSAAAGELASPWAVKIYSGYEKDVELVLKGEKKDLGTATAEGKTFVGWSADGLTLANGEVTPTGDITYRPVFNYTVTFNSNGGSAVESKTVAKAEDYVAALPAPTNDPKVFAGWYKDEALTKKVETLPLTTCTLYAKWEAPTTVTYQLDGGMYKEELASFTFSADTAHLNTGFDIIAISPASTNQVGKYWNVLVLKSNATTGLYDFVAYIAGSKIGDYTLGTDYDFVIEKHDANKNAEAAAFFASYCATAKAGDKFLIEKDATAKTAKVSKIDLHTESFEKVYYKEFTDLPTPEKADCIFQGWVDAEDKAVTSIPAAEGPTAITLTASWKAGSLTKEAIMAEFLKDVNASAKAKGYITEDITADKFYETFSEKFMNVTAVADGVYTTSGLMKDDEALLAKYGWLIEFIGARMGDKKYGNTALVAFGLKSANDTNLVTASLNYADRTITNSIDNFLNGANENLHGGSSSGAVPADFSAAGAYDGLVLAAANAGFTIAE